VAATNLYSVIEGNNQAVLYTGDIRSEPWFVNNLTRNPFLIEYTSGLKPLDCIYLDTSNTQPVEFQTKAEGLKELLQKVSKYPADTIFHFSAWTFGYEEVWMALSKTLMSPVGSPPARTHFTLLNASQVHVDNYKLKLYQALRGDSSDKTNSTGVFNVHEGPVLAGYQCGNTPQVGCLTSDTNVRIHSCENGMRCKAITDNTVWIRPIVTRTALGGEMAEAGVGGGGGDLTQRPELEFDSDAVIGQLLAM
jgi:DNA cross-link repair 1C protein